MFTWINKQGVKSSKGFVVQSVDRFVIEYRESGKCMSIEVESEYAPGQKPCERITMSALSKWNDGSSVNVKKQKEILKNFTEAMEFQGIKVIVI